MFALVDDEDYDFLNQWKWCAHEGRNTYYAVRWENGGLIRMHRLIMKAPKGKLVDHKNGNGLDNQKHNLRKATSQQNAMNMQKYATNTSGYPGVGSRKRGTWRARISVSGKRINLGNYEKFEDAVAARKEAEKTYYGEYARNG